MLKTLKDLCDAFPKVAILQSPLDNIAAQLFTPSHDLEYVCSTTQPEERYGISVDQTLLNHHNDRVKNFESYGPNEQYLINKVLYSPCNVLYVVGGIGVGKTRFSHFLMKEILPELVLGYEKGKENGPCTIYYDFLRDCILPESEDSPSIKKAFLDSFCDRVEAEINSHDFFDLDDEVGVVWDELIAEYQNQYQKHLALSYIINQIRTLEAERDDLVDDYPETIKQRKVIRQKILGEQSRRISYLALLIKYIRDHHFDSDPAALVLIVDNVDREPSLVQQQVKLVLKPFAKNCGGRTIINARQTTYYQQFDDGASDPMDLVAYCGPDPLEILNSRLNIFFDHHDNFAEFYKPNHLSSLVVGIKYIKDSFLSTKAFRLLFSSLCGRSARKSLLLAQNIICNSVYDPSKTETDREKGGSESIRIGLGDVLRAVIVGTDAIFRTTPQNIIDNIYEVEQYPGKSYLLKLRILKLLECNRKNGVKINRLLDIISGFEYDLSMICDALNELKSIQKRLIWSDAVRMNFLGEDDLVRHGPTRVHISTAGLGYITNLCTNINYIQEIMLDTNADENQFGHGWKYDLLEDRFELIQKFLTLLSNFDRDEISFFMANKGHDEYVYAFGNNELITKNMFKDVRNTTDRILSSVVANLPHGDRREELRDFKAKHIGIYDDRIISLENFELEMS